MIKCSFGNFPHPGILSEVSNSQKGRKKDKLRQKQQSLGKTTTFGSLRYRKKSLINLSYFLDDSSGHVHVVSWISWIEWKQHKKHLNWENKIKLVMFSYITYFQLHYHTICIPCIPWQWTWPYTVTVHRKIIPLML